MIIDTINVVEGFVFKPNIKREFKTKSGFVVTLLVDETENHIYWQMIAQKEDEKYESRITSHWQAILVLKTPYETIGLSTGCYDTGIKKFTPFIITECEKI